MPPSSALPPQEQGDVAVGFDKDETVADLLDRLIESELTSSQVLELTDSLGDGVIDLLFDELARGRRRASAVRAFDRSMAEVPGIALMISADRGADPMAEAYRAAGLRVLARRGTQRDFQLVFALSTAHELTPAPIATLDALEEALVGIFERYPGHVPAVRPYIGGLDAGQRVRVIRSLGQHGQARPYGSERTLALLADLLVEFKPYRTMILAQMGRLDSSSAEAGAMARVRGLLGSPDRAVQREAVLTVGKLEDMESFGLLIDMLEHEDKRLQSTVHWSLKRISGRTFRPDPRQWRAWHRAENTWWAERAPELFGLLTGEKAGDMAVALNELATHRLFRHSIAAALSPLFDSRRNDIVLLCCSAAYSLRSRAVLPGLVQSLSHPDARIQNKALQGLTLITGIDLPPSADAWREALDV